MYVDVYIPGSPQAVHCSMVVRNSLHGSSKTTILCLVLRLPGESIYTYCIMLYSVSTFTVLASYVILVKHVAKCFCFPTSNTVEVENSYSPTAAREESAVSSALQRPFKDGTDSDWHSLNLFPAMFATNSTCFAWFLIWIDDLVISQVAQGCM